MVPPLDAVRLQREQAIDRSMALRARINRLYRLVDSAERRAATRHREVLALRASAEALCESSARVRGRPDSTA
jgi:hypothetical protein